MQVIQLENAHLKVSIASKGAELQSLFDKTIQEEKMWSGNPEFWAKHSPVLFPIVGALKNDTYVYQGQKYKLPRHGFARDLEFENVEASDTEAIFRLNDTVSTRENYPFSFIFYIRYKLSGPVLSCTYEVEHPDTDPLLFSVGAHPAFAISTKNGITYSDYSLGFNADNLLRTHKITDNLIGDEIDELELTNGKLTLQHDLFYNDALVIKNLKSNEITLSNSANAHGLKFRFSNFPYFGIWAAKDADFVCLEPWCGIADSIDHDQQLEHKEGINKLSNREKWSRTWEVEVF